MNKKIIAAATAAVVVLGSAPFANAATTRTAAIGATPDIYFSASSARTNLVPLSRATVKGNLYATVEAAGNNIASVTFRFDDPLGNGAAIRTEVEHPYDFAGGSWDDGSAIPFDTTTVADGPHSILAEVTLKNGKEVDAYARFTVANTGATRDGSTTTTAKPAPPTTAAPAPSVTTTTVKPVTPTTAAPPTPATPTGANTTQKNCLAKPSACGYPDATNTGFVGAGLTEADLTPSGSITVTKDGTVLDKLDIKGEVNIQANNVTIKRSRITSGDYYPIRYFDKGNTGLLVEDTEIHSTSGDVTAGISFENYTARRVNVWGSADGLKADNNVLIEDSYIHDLTETKDAKGNVESHNDGIQSTGGSNLTVRHTTCDLSMNSGANACMQLGNEGAKQSNLLVENNLFDGGGWTINMGAGTNLKFLNNRWGHDAGYGIISGLSDYTWTGNIWDDTLGPAK